MAGAGPPPRRDPLHGSSHRRRVHPQGADPRDRRRRRGRGRAIDGQALKGGDTMVWLTDTKGRRSASPLDKLAYVEIDADDGDRSRSASALAERRRDAAPDLLDRRLLFVTGKGGVGKTTIAAALALLAAEHGKRTLVVEVDAKGNLADLFERRSGRLRAHARCTRASSRCRWTPRSRSRSTSGSSCKLPVLGRLGPLARTLRLRRQRRAGREGDPHRRQVRAGRCASRSRAADYDLVVVDAAATGHIVGQLAAPQAIKELVQVGLVREPDRLDARHPRRPGAAPASSSSPRPRRCRSTRRSSWSTGCATETDVDLAAVVVNRVLPELFGTREEEVVRARCASPTRDRACWPRGRRRARPRCSTRRALAVTLRRTRAAHLARLRDEPSTCPLLYVPYLFARNHGAARHAHGRRRPRRGARVLMARAEPTAVDASSSCSRRKEIVISCGSGGVGKTTTAAAAGAMAAAQPRRQGARAHRRPGPAAGQRPRARGVRQRRDAGAAPRRSQAAGVEPRGELWAAMLDTKQSWDDLVLPPRARRGDRDAILDNPLYQNITGRFVQSHDYIAMERLYEIHASGAYDLIVVDTPPTRNAIDFLEAPERMADFFCSRLLRWLTLPYRVGGKRGARVLNVASRPFYQVADRILGSQFLEDIAEFFLLLPVDVRRVRRAGRGGRAAAARPAHDLRGRHHARGGAAARGRVLLRRSSTSASFHLGALVLNKVLPDYLLDRRRRARPPTSSPTTRRRSPRQLAGHRRCRRSPTRRAPLACCARSASRSATSRSSRCARPSCAPSSPACPRSSSRVPELRDRHRRRRRTGSRSATHLFGPSPEHDLPYHRLATTLVELARTNTALGGADARARRAARRRRWQPLADLSSPTSCCSRRSRARRATASSCSRRCGPTTGQTLLPARPRRHRRRRGRTAAASRRAWRDGRDRRGRHHGARRRRSGSASSASRCGAQRPARSRLVTRGDADHVRRRRRASSSARTSRSFDRFAPHDRRGHVPVRRRRDRVRERAPRRRRRDRPRRRARDAASRARTR